MQPGKLAAMANQIAQFFHSYPDDEAEAGVRRHLEAFWTPKMVATFRHHLAEDPTDVDPLVARAMRHDPDAVSPTERALAPEAATGAMATDAG